MINEPEAISFEAFDKILELINNNIDGYHVTYEMIDGKLEVEVQTTKSKNEHAYR